MSRDGYSGRCDGRGGGYSSGGGYGGHGDYGYEWPQHKQGYGGHGGHHHGYGYDWPQQQPPPPPPPHAVRWEDGRAPNKNQDRQNYQQGHDYAGYWQPQQQQPPSSRHQGQCSQYGQQIDNGFGRAESLPARFDRPGSLDVIDSSSRDGDNRKRRRTSGFDADCRRGSSVSDSSIERAHRQDEQQAQTTSVDAYQRLLELELSRLRRLVPNEAQRQPKLLILDLNGFLVYRRRSDRTEFESDRFKATPSRAHDLKEGNFLVWLRPHARNFLEYALSRYHVAVWSSAMLRNIRPLLRRLLGGCDGGERRLAFVWSQDECTNSTQMHPTDPRRPLFLKDVAKIFSAPEFRGLYNAANTLLIDDDASKVALNPPHSCIVPDTYEGAGEAEDEASGRGGLAETDELRLWLERLLVAPDVPSFVKENIWPPRVTAPPDRLEIDLNGDEEEKKEEEQPDAGGTCTYTVYA